MENLLLNIQKVDRSEGFIDPLIKQYPLLCESVILKLLKDIFSQLIEEKATKNLKLPLT